MLNCTSYSGYRENRMFCSSIVNRGSGTGTCAFTSFCKRETERQIFMKKRVIAAMTAAVMLMLAGCGSTGAATGTTESAAAATTQAATAEVAAEMEWQNDPTAYLSGITASDYVDLPADYAALTVEVEPAAEVTDEDIESKIDEVRNSNRELQEVKGRTTVQDGDIVNIDYVGRIDGEEFSGGSDSDYDLTIGSGSFIEGFESGLIGHQVGETVTLELTFPEDYGDSTKAGVDAEFDVTINSIQEYVVPELTNEFVAGLEIVDEFGNTVSTADEFRTYVRNYLIESNESQYTQRLEEAIKSALVAKSTFKQDAPPAMVERMRDSMVQELTSYGMQYGIDLPTLMQLAYGSTEESYMQDIEDMAKESVQRIIVLKAVGDKENLCMSDDQFQAELETAVNSASGYTSAADVPREDAEAYREVMDRQKIMDFLRSKTNVTAPAADEGSTGATTAAETESAQ